MPYPDLDTREGKIPALLRLGETGTAHSRGYYLFILYVFAPCAEPRRGPCFLTIGKKRQKTGLGEHGKDHVNSCKYVSFTSKGAGTLVPFFFFFLEKQATWLWFWTLEFP